MNYSNLITELKKVLRADQIKMEESMSRHTSFRIGGKADIFLLPETTSEVTATMGIIEKTDIPYFIIGGGNNLLVSDLGYRGIIVSLENYKSIEVDEDRITASSGTLLRELSKAAVENSLTGYEFASGIPGTIGGATFMNAGAYGGEHKDIIERVTFYENGQIAQVDNEGCAFSYRDSFFRHGAKVILTVTLKLKAGNKEEIELKIEELTKKRIEKQPLEYPSAGSTFKRPEGYFAGKLIEDIGYKGKQIGGAQVSEKHSGFIINKDHATAEDVLNLIKEIQKTVKIKKGVDIKPEVIFIGEKNETDA